MVAIAMAEEVSSAVPPRRLPLHALRYGGIAGAIGGAWVVAAFAFGFYAGFVETIGIIVPIAAVILGTMRWRDRVTGGETRFAQAFSAGLAVGLCYAAAAALVFLIFAHLRLDLVLDQWLQVQTLRMQQTGATSEQIVEAIEAARPRLTPAFFAKQRFVYSLVVCLVVSLIAAIVIPRRRI